MAAALAGMRLATLSMLCAVAACGAPSTPPSVTPYFESSLPGTSYVVAASSPPLPEADFCADLEAHAHVDVRDVPAGVALTLRPRGGVTMAALDQRASLLERIVSGRTSVAWNDDDGCHLWHLVSQQPTVVVQQGTTAVTIQLTAIPEAVSGLRRDARRVADELD